MTATATDPLSSRDEPLGHPIDCATCGNRYDALQAAWCECIVKERTLVCPQCHECFCRADLEYKRNVWTTAPDALWQRKQRSIRERSVLPDNPSPEEVRRPLVLVVDDDRDIRALASHLITGRGLGCIHAADGADGLVLAHAYRPDLILTDALMPRMDGRELCRLVKCDPELAETRVVIMSSVYTAGRFKREALSHFKADEFLAKPVDATSLFRLLQRQETQTEAAEPEPVPPSQDEWVPPAHPPETPQPLLSADPSHDVPLAIAFEHEEAPAVTPVEPPSTVDLTTTDEAPLADEVIDEASDDAALPERIRITARELVRLRALGLDAELAALANAVPRLRIVDLIALRTAGVPFEFMHAIDPDLLATFSVSDVTTLHSAGCSPDVINLLRRLELSTVEIIGIVSAGVPLEWVRAVMGAAGRPLTAADLMRLHGAAVDVEYIRALRESRSESGSVDDWIRLWTLGVTPEFVEGAADSLDGECTFEELTQLWLSGVDVALLQQLRDGI